jgi:hypothetical protein
MGPSLSLDVKISPLGSLAAQALGWLAVGAWLSGLAAQGLGWLAVGAWLSGLAAQGLGCLAVGAWLGWVAVGGRLGWLAVGGWPWVVGWLCGGGSGSLGLAQPPLGLGG